MLNNIILSDAARHLVSNYVLPYKSFFESQRTLPVAAELFEMLDEHGDCPSILINNKDPESVHLSSVRDRLQNISLKEHTYKVAIKMTEDVKNRYGNDYKVHIPAAVITALAHDIGKIPHLISSMFNIRDHQMISSMKITEMLAGINPQLISLIIPAVESHHSFSENSFTLMLKEADRESRQEELLKLSPYTVVPSLDSWFNVEEFYMKIESHINFSRGPANWKAFTFRGMIYCRPDFVFNIARALCKEAGIVDLTFLDESSSDEALFRIVKHIRDCGLIPDLFAPDRFAQRFAIRTHTGKKYKTILTPLKPVWFYDMNELEARKIGFLEIIKSVWPG